MPRASQAVAGRGHLVAESFQGACTKRRTLPLSPPPVLLAGEVLCAAPSPAPACWALLGLRQGLGQEDAEGRALAGFALHGEIPFALLHDAVLHHRQAEARALPHRLGGEEGLKRRAWTSGLIPMPVSRTGQADIGARRGGRPPATEAAGDPSGPAIGGFQRDATAVGHGVPGYFDGLGEWSARSAWSAVYGRDPCWVTRSAHALADEPPKSCTSKDDLVQGLVTFGARSILRPCCHVSKSGRRRLLFRIASKKHGDATRPRCQS